jgi:chemotaxis protein MotB
MNINRMLWLSVALFALLITSGCGGMKKLEDENANLKQQVSELEQVKSDYADKLQAVERMSAAEQEKLRSEMDQMRADLTSKLNEQIREKEVLVQKLDDLTVITIGEEALFGSGIADLTLDGAKTIDKIAETLNQYPGYHIRIEGHTDDVPIGKKLKDKYASNWELSTDRAGSVIRYMIYGLKVAPERLSAAGFAHYRPTADNDTREGRAQNRRIRAVVFKESN